MVKSIPGGLGSFFISSLAISFFFQHQVLFLKNQQLDFWHQMLKYFQKQVQVDFVFL